MRALLLGLFMTLSVQVGAEDARYQAIVLHEGGRTASSGSLHPRVFLLDTREGHMWTWEENALVRGGPGPDRFGAQLTYQGRLRVGQRPGEVIRAPETPTR